MLLLSLTLACQSSFKSRALPEVDKEQEELPGPWDQGGGPGGSDTDTGVWDTDSGGTADTEDTGGGGTTGGTDGGTDGGGGTTTPDPDPEACYPGDDESWTTCVPVVSWSSSWDSDYDYPDPYGGDSQYSAPARYIDLSSADPGLALAPNFVLEEFMQESKGRYGVFQSHVVAHLQEIRDRTGSALYVTSGFRSPGYNAGISGSATYSRHLYGDAADFYSDTHSLSSLEDYCYDLGAGYVALYDDGHIHCDWRDDPLDTAFYNVSGLTGPVSHEEFSVALVRGGVWAAETAGWDEGEPLKVWRALDREGRVLDEQIGATFEPPPGAATVELTVGGHFVIVDQLGGEE